MEQEASNGINPLNNLLRESEQAAWDALAQGDFSGFGVAADTWVADWAGIHNPEHPTMPSLEKNTFRELILLAARHRSAKAPDYEGIV
jgi:hypothetical protein